MLNHKSLIPRLIILQNVLTVYSHGWESFETEKEKNGKVNRKSLQSNGPETRDQEETTISGNHESAE